MNIHEYQAKQIFREFGVSVPNGQLAKSVDEVKTYANEILGKVLVTKQTGPDGKKVNRLLIEEGCKFKKELYLSFTVDRVSSRVVMIGSEEGGM